MPSEHKKTKEKSRSRNVRKRQQPPPVKKANVKKISEKYLQEEKQIGATLKQREKITNEDDDKIKQNEIDFFCDPFSTVRIEKKNSEEGSSDRNGEIEVEEASQKSEPPSARSNGSPENTHLASTYIGHENDAVVEKFELKRVPSCEFDLFFTPSAIDVTERRIDEETGLKMHRDAGLYSTSNVIVGNHNKNLLINRLHESGSTDFTDGVNEFKNNVNFIEGGIYRLTSTRKFTPIYVPPTPMASELAEQRINEKRLLKIHISRLVFENHQSFTSENVIARVVEKLFSEYERRKKVDYVGTLRNKLNNLREARMRSFPEDNKTAKVVKEEELALSHQIKTVREKLHAEEKYDYMVTKNLLESWKSLKAIRSKQSFALTTFGLRIQKQETDAVQKQVEWQQRYDIELNEMITEEFEKYNSKKQKFKELVKGDHKVSLAELGGLKKPKRPDIDKIVASLNEIYEDVPSNLPDIVILSVNQEKKEVKQPKSKEKLKKIGRYSYRFELQIDDEAIGSTKYCELDEEFVIEVQSAFIVKLTRKIPEKIKLLIFESKSTTRKLSEIIIPLPEDDELYEEAQPMDFEFSSKRLKRIDSRSRFSSLRRTKSRKLSITSGRVTLSMGWTFEDIRMSSEDMKVKKVEISPEKKSISHEALRNWFDSKLLDPLDPDTENLVKYLNQDSDVETVEPTTPRTIEGNFFRFNEEELAFCSEEEFNSIERLQLLHARSKNDISYKNKRLVPLVERELELERDKDLKIIDEASIADPIDLQRYRGRKYLRKVYETIANHCDFLNRDRLNTNILIGDEPPTFGSLSLAFLEIFGPRRPLKPVRRATSSRASCKISEQTNFSISVMVVRATNVPIRSEDVTHVSSRKSSNTPNVGPNKFTPFKSLSSHPHVFVVVSLKDHQHTTRTSTAEGTNPMWNEQLTVPFDLNTDGSKKLLSIDLYDEVIEDLIDNVTEVYQRITSKWLGCIKIPVANIIANQRIEGTFEVLVPSVLLGYSRPKFSPSDFHSQIPSSVENLPQMSLKTHLNLFISLEPQTEIPKLIASGLECIEVEGVETQIKMWYEQLKLEFPTRAVGWNPLVALLNGKRACITRLLHPLKFPFEKREGLTEPKIRRFVSLIPIQNDTSTMSTSCTGLMGVWLSNTHILGLMTASNKDLGVLLTCFYLELGIAAWLILGTSVTSGECCFVLTRESNEFFITDPSTGKKYSSQDTLCPLSKCFCLVNQYNVWANIQRERRIFMMHYDVNRSFDWRPLFQKVVDIPNETVHDVSFAYERSFDIRDLQRTIQAKIIKKINSWRSHRKTVWNRYVSENLKHILVKLEDEVCFENEVEDHVDMLRSIYTNYKITGFSINTKYTSLSSLVTEVKNTGIHLNLDNKVEFATSVYVREYANNVLSIWIFLASLIPKL